MTASRTGADSAQRVLDLLFAFESQPLATVRELSDKTGVPLPTAHRYVAMLRERGLIEEARFGKYRLTMRVTSLGQAARRATSVIDVVHPFMQALSEEVDETVLLIQPIADMPVCTHRVETRHRLRLSFEVGQRTPALRGASAHLLLSRYPAAVRRKFVEDAMARGEQAPQSGLEEFLEEVERDAVQGWAVSSAEIDEGVWSAAVTIRSEGKPIGTLSVPCPVFRIDDQRTEVVIEAARRTAAQINAALGS